jgi:hypothetical protein
MVPIDIFSGNIFTPREETESLSERVLERERESLRERVERERESEREFTISSNKWRSYHRKEYHRILIIRYQQYIMDPLA